MIQPPLPERLGPYRILRVLGRGGMGVVYEVRREGSDRPLVLKAIHAHLASPTALLRFQREAELMARVRHPNVVAVHELLRTPTGPVIVSDLVEGEPLSRKVRSGWRDDRAAARLVLQLADAVDALHRASILHRDLKPENVVVRPDGTPVLLDFGVARDQAAAARLTATGALLGTPNYMSPEQANGEEPAEVGTAFGPATDVYGLGTILFELLAGRRPYDDEASLQTCLFLVASGTPPRWPSATRSDVPRGLEAVVRQAMSPAPADRYPTAAALREDLERFLAGSTSEAELRLYPRASRRGLALGASLAGLALAVLALGLRPDEPATARPVVLPPPPPVPAPAPVAPATPAPLWQELARSLKPDVALGADEDPVLLRTIRQEGLLQFGAAGWFVDPTHLVTGWVDVRGEWTLTVRSLLGTALPVPARHGGLRLVRGAPLGLSTDLVELDPATLAPSGARAPLPFALDRGAPLAASTDGHTIAAVASGLEVVVLRRRPGGALQRLDVRLQPPQGARAITHLALGGAWLAVAFRCPGATPDASVAVTARLDPAAFTVVERRDYAARITALAISDGGEHVAVGTSEGELHVGDPARLAALRALEGPAHEEVAPRLKVTPPPHGHTGGLSGAVFTRDGRLYSVSIEADRVVPSELRRWTFVPPTGTWFGRLVSHPAAQVHGLGRSPDGRYLVLETGADRGLEGGSPTPRACAVEVWLVDASP